MNLVQRIAQILTERVVAVVGSLFASQVESLVALQQAEQLDELEERARQFELAGKPHLATVLRTRAQRINPDNPGILGQSIIRHLETEATDPHMPLLETAVAAEDGPTVAAPPDALDGESVRSVFGDLWTGRKRTTRSGPSRHRVGRTTQGRRLGPRLVAAIEEVAALHRDTDFWSCGTS